MLTFIDESGDHNLELKTLDGNYSVFVLGGILIDKEKYDRIDREFRDFKKSFFGGEDFIIHTAELTRPSAIKKDPRNRILSDKKHRAEFYSFMNDFISKADLKAVFMAIKKIDHRNQYVFPADPYDLAFENILNRVLNVSDDDENEIYPERRNAKLDAHLENNFQKHCDLGIRFHGADVMKRRIKKLQLVDKGENITGLQIADLMVTPVGRHSLGKSPRNKDTEILFSTVHKKIPDEFCLTTFP